MSRGKMEGMDIIHPWGVPVALFLTIRRVCEVLLSSKPKRKIRLCHYVCVRPLLPFGLLSLPWRLFLLRASAMFKQVWHCSRLVVGCPLGFLLLARHSPSKLGSALASFVGSARLRLDAKVMVFFYTAKFLLKKIQEGAPNYLRVVLVMGALAFNEVPQ